MRDELLKLAHDSIENSLDGKDIKSIEELSPEFKKEAATFVTLNLNGNLRGCIGTLIAHRTLYDDIIHNAKAAAFGDYRFPPLTKEEFKNVEIEVSLLSKPQNLSYENIDDLKSKLTIGTDGVILRKGGYQATFLPQVWEQLPTFELFFNHLCQKAGLGGNCLDDLPQIDIYQVEKIG